MIVYTAIFEGYDTPKPRPDHPAVERWVCYTDDPDLDAAGWERVIITSEDGWDGRLIARLFKTHPPHADRTLWVDGSIRFGAALIDEVLAGLDRSEWWCFPHPDRVSLLDEARVAAGRPGTDPAQLIAQAEHYIAEGWTDDRLWATGVIGRRLCPKVDRVNREWFAEIQAWSSRDQLSLPPLLARHGIEPATPPTGTLWANPWMVVEEHRSTVSGTVAQ